MPFPVFFFQVRQANLPTIRGGGPFPSNIWRPMLYTASDGSELYFRDSEESPETSGSAVLSVGIMFGTMISEIRTCS